MGIRAMQRNADRQVGAQRSRHVSACRRLPNYVMHRTRRRWGFIQHPAPLKPRRWRVLYSR
jgi:hypothetical protein